MTLSINMRIEGLENWVIGVRDYRKQVMEAVYEIMVRHAPKVQTWMRENATWDDECLPGKDYLKCIPYRDDARSVAGVIAYYDEDYYRELCPGQDITFSFSAKHELKEFVEAGKIGILSPTLNSELTVFGEPFHDIWFEVLELFEGVAF